MFSREKTSELNIGRNGLGRDNGGMFLKRKKGYKLIKAINGLFDKRIKHQRIKKYGEYSKIRTAVKEEPMKLAQYLRGEKKGYVSVKI